MFLVLYMCSHQHSTSEALKIHACLLINYVPELCCSLSYSIRLAAKSKSNQTIVIIPCFLCTTRLLTSHASPICSGLMKHFFIDFPHESVGLFVIQLLSQSSSRSWYFWLENPWIWILNSRRSRNVSLIIPRWNDASINSLRRIQLMLTLESSAKLYHNFISSGRIIMLSKRHSPLLW